MKRQSVIATLSLTCVLLLAAVLAGLRPKTVLLQLTPQDRGEVLVSLFNRTTQPVRYYDSLSRFREGEVPDLTTIRLRTSDGEILKPRMSGTEGFWSRNISLVRKVPVILNTMPAGGSHQVVTHLPTLLKGYPDQSGLQRATHAQIQCTVFLEKGVVQHRSEWIPLAPADKGETTLADNAWD